MLKEVNAALAAAKKYKPRNEGDRSESEFVVAMLSDAAAHASVLAELADSYEKAEKIRLAESALREAQAG